MIKFTVPTRYNAAYVLPRKRSENSVAMLGEIEIGLREVSAEAAPVAHVLSDTSPHGEVRFNPFLPRNGEGVEIRCLDGRFYVARWAVEDFARAAASTDDGAPFNGGFRSDDGTYVLMGMTESHCDTAVTSRAEVERAVGEIRKWEDRFDVTAAAMVRRAEDLVVIDGVVHELIGEPALQIDSHRGDIAIRLVQSRAPDTPFVRPAYLAKGVTFGVDQLPRAIETAEAMAIESGGRVRNHVAIDMISPWAVRYRGEHHLLQDVAKSVVFLLSDGLAWIPAQAGLAWHDLATALEETDGVTRQLVDALRRLHASMSQIGADRCDEWGTPRGTKYDEHGLQEQVDFALALWDSRDDAGIEWIENGLDAVATYSGELMAHEVLSLEDADKVGERLGRSIETLADEASAGRSRLIVVEDGRGVVAAALVASSDDGPAVVETVTRHGSDASPAVREIALAHAMHVPYGGHSLSAELDGMGL